MTAQDEWAAIREKNIHVGDWVSIRIRGGHQEGYVKKIATSPDETPHPPKVPSCCAAMFGCRGAAQSISDGGSQGLIKYGIPDPTTIELLSTQLCSQLNKLVWACVW